MEALSFKIVRMRSLRDDPRPTSIDVGIYGFIGNI
jgi:hypothetical protein